MCFPQADAFMLQQRAFKPAATQASTVKMHVPWTANFLVCTLPLLLTLSLFL